MSKGNRIRAVRPAAASETASHDESGAAPAPEEASMDEEGLDLGEFEIEENAAPTPSRFGWLVPALAMGAIALWTGLYIWAMQAELLNAAAAAPAEWTRWIIDWSVPVLLVCVIWILAMRNSRAEAQRFASTAAMLSQESRELEDRLTVVNRELSLAREFLGSQSLELESLGRVASERLSTHAGELQRLITDNGAQVEAIGQASETALGNMTRLRDDLPVVANSARDVSNQVGNAGRTAQEQLDRLVTGFERLNQFGKASENQVSALDQKIGASLQGFEGHLGRIEQIVARRFESLKDEAGVYREEIDSAESTALGALNERMSQLQTEAKAISARLREAEGEAMQQLDASRQRFEADITGTIQKLEQLDLQAIEASRSRIKGLNEEATRFDDRLAVRDRKLLEEIERRQEEFATREAQATEVLAQRLADLDDALAQRREEQTREAEKLVEQSAAMSEQLDALNSLIGQIGSQGDKTREGLTTGMAALEEKLEAKRAALRETEEQIVQLTDSSVRLLEIIQSGARHSREDLPEAIGGASSNLEAIEQRTAALSGMMFQIGQKGHELSDYLVTAQAQIEMADTSIETLKGRLAEQSEDTLAKLQGLRAGFAKLSDESQNLAEGTQDSLRTALTQLEEATQSTFATIEQGTQERLATLAGSLSQNAVRELESALRTESAESVSQLEQATAHASGVGREVTMQLRDQLAKVNELTINLEQRVARARELAEEQVGNDFARRMALITDTLNSNAIDIASALSHEVTDTAWDSYLKGDRGIFTRRAVRLIDSGEAREIADLYQNDEAFRGNVSRYIHDFEAMLRSMLSTRDGNALGVTILGSDMGKLYVVLAQAIERFRN